MFYQLYLGSGSPRRKELLSWINIPFEIVTSDIDEVSHCEKPLEIVQDLARQKGRDVWDKLAIRSGFGESFHPLLISADTLVFLGDEVFGKPENRQGAKEMLLKLSGKTHLTATGVHFMAHHQETKELIEKTFVCETKVTFDEIPEDLLEIYLDSGESLDKAGSYGIQGRSLSFISHLNGSYSNVVGLPLSHLCNELDEFLKPFSKGERWRNLFLMEEKQ